MNRDDLYFHFANLGLVIIGLLSIQRIASVLVLLVLIPGSVAGFLFSWHMRKARPPHIDTFIGMLSLGSVVLILSRLYDTQISFDSLLKIFSTALMWLCLFQSFGLERGKSYAVLQFISVSLLISSVSLALEQETFFVVLLALFLFILIFTMRLNLVCEKQNQGSIIIGDREEVMSLWQQIKTGSIMFSIVLILSATVYPAVPRFNNLSLSWLPSTLLGLPERVPLLKLLGYADRNIKEDAEEKERLVDDGSKKRETKEDLSFRNKIKKKEEGQDETIDRFQAAEYDKNIDAFKIESLIIKTDKTELPLDSLVNLYAELRLSDNSIIPATKLVDWKVVGTAKLSIDKDGKLIPHKEGDVQISASYLGNFSNDLNIRIIAPIKSVEKKGIFFYFAVFILWLVIAVVAGASAWIFMRAKRLSEMYALNPKGFIKQLYDALCRALKVYGMPRLNYMAYREYCNAVIVGDGRDRPLRPESMQALTEIFLEARFSTHEISKAQSQKIIELFHEVKDVILAKEVRAMFWKGILFRLYVLDVLLVSRQ